MSAIRRAAASPLTFGRKCKIPTAMEMPERMLKWFIPTPRTCFLWSLFLLLLSAALATDSRVLRKRLDGHGNNIFAPNGRPEVETDQWASFWHGWPSNLSMLAAVTLFCIGLSLVILRRLHKLKGHR